MLRPIQTIYLLDVFDQKRVFPSCSCLHIITEKVSKIFVTKMQKMRHICFTLNNYADSEVEQLENMVQDDQFQYIIYAFEVSSSETPHLQGYVCFNARKYTSTVRKTLRSYGLERMHWEKTKGTPQQNIAYCKKGGDFREHGVPPKTGGEVNQQRWACAKDLAIRGELDSIPEDIFCRYYNTLKRIQFDYRYPPTSISVLDNEWHYGTTATGKSYSVRESYPDHCIKPLNKWWDNYYGETTVILDDVSKKHMVWIADLLKVWSDHYPFNAEFKGGSMTIRPRRIVVTSNISLEKACEDLEEETYLEPLRRRFRQIYYPSFTTDNQDRNHDNNGDDDENESTDSSERAGTVRDQID